MSRSTYWLGGIPARRWVTRRQVLTYVGLGVAAVAVLMLVLVTRSPIMIVALAVVLFAAFLLWQHPDASGGQWIRSAILEGTRSVLARWGRWDEYSPGVDRRPWLLGDMRVVGVAGSDGGPELCLIDAEDTYTAVLELNGMSAGVLSDMIQDQAELGLAEVLDALCDHRQPVSQVDFITQAVPARVAADQYLEWTKQRMSPKTTSPAERSMLELADWMKSTTEYRSWAVLRMPISELRAKARAAGLKITPESIAETALDTVGEATRLMIHHGIGVRAGLTPTQVAAVIRGLLWPGFSVDDTSGIDGFWDAWPGFEPADRGRGLVTYLDRDSDQRWYHATAVVPRDGFPADKVAGRWLDGAALEADVTHRVVAVQFALLPHRQARDLARDQVTSARTRIIRSRRRGQVSTGEDEADESLAAAVMGDITRRGRGGVIPVVRVMVSSPSLWELRQDREAMHIQAERRLQVRTLSWTDGRHGPGVLSVLPLGIGVKRP